MLIVVGVMLIPVVTQSADTFDITSRRETVTAVNDVATAEVITLEETPEAITTIKVNGVDLEEADYTLVGDELTLAVDASVADDVININYTYQMDVGTGQGALIGLLPLVFVIMIAVGGISAIKFGK